MGKRDKRVAYVNPIALARSRGPPPTSGPTIRDYLTRDRPSLEEAIERISTRNKGCESLAAWEERVNDSFRADLKADRDKKLKSRKDKVAKSKKDRKHKRHRKMKIAKSSSKRKKRDYSSDSSVDSGSVSSVSSSGSLSSTPQHHRKSSKKKAKKKERKRKHHHRHHDEECSDSNSSQNEGQDETVRPKRPRISSEDDGPLHIEKVDGVKSHEIIPTIAPATSTIPKSS